MDTPETPPPAEPTPPDPRGGQSGPAGWVPNYPRRGHFVFPPGGHPYWVPTDPPPPPGPEQPYYGGHQPPMFVPPHAGGPGNDAAIGSLITGCISLAILFLTGGIAGPLTLIASGIATFFGRRGQNNVDQGRTNQHRDTAVAGFWVGIAGIALSALAIIAWIVLIIVIASTDDTTWAD